jgi:hypothetical protein
MTLRILLSLFLLSPLAARAGVVDDMAAFERLFIPALALTNQPKLPAERVEQALRRLNASWPEFRKRFSIEPALATAAGRTERALAQAQARLAEGKRAEAHDVLEGVRLAFFEARRSAGIELYVDRLTEFHDPMEAFVKLAESTASTEQQMRAALARASGLWRRAEQPGFEGTLFGFDDAKYELLRKRIAAERAILDALEQTLARADRAETRALAGRLKSGFAQIYVMFGDFGAS